MALPDITFINGTGGVGQQPAGEDFISGMVIYSSSYPSGYSSNNNIKEYFQIQDAEADGIVSDYSDETQATGSYLVTNAGAAGDIITIKITEPDPVATTKSVTIVSYTRLSSDSSASILATSIAAAINAGTTTHGYTASASTATVTITARKGLGIFLNSGTPITVTITGTIAGTITQFSGGVASKYAVWHYHIAEFFRMNSTGILYTGIFSVPGGTPDFSEISTLQNFANGKIRQVLVYKDFSALSASADIGALQTIATTLETNHMPLSILLAADISGTANLSSLTDLSTLTAKNVSLVIGQDGAALGWSLFKAYGKSITCGGAALGTLSASTVSQSIMWEGKFNLSNGTELETAAFANGTLWRSVATSLLTQIDRYRYIFVMKQIGFTGTFFNNSHTAISVTSDYAYIENNRTIDKAKRMVRSNQLPLLGSQLTLNSDGTITSVSVETFQNAGNAALDQMVRDGDLSGGTTIVNPNQNVQSQGYLSENVNLLGIGIARAIKVTIGFVQSL